MLDESLSALDIQTRREVELELQTILRELKLTTVMVSNQYSDALNFADNIIVLESGRVIQEGTHPDLLRHPRSSYIAALVGVNRLTGTVVEAGDPGGTCRVALGDGMEVVAAPASPLARDNEATIILHPRAVTLHAARPPTEANALRGTILQSQPISASVAPDNGAIAGLIRVVLVLGPDLPLLRAEIEVAPTSDLSLAEGETVYAVFDPADAIAYLHTEASST
jgi:ABC-type Fe3+/spermidine/putrescine transport system ATPase subunit